MLTQLLRHYTRVHQLSQITLKTASFFRLASSSASKDEMDQLKVNPFFNKYADKIAAAQKDSPEEFLAKVDSYFQIKTPSSSQTSGRGFSPTGKAKTDDAVSYLKTKKLDSVLKVDAVKDMSADDIGQIWKLHHQKQYKIAAVMPANIYELIFERSKLFPTFLYPLPRDQGYEFIVAQFEGHECHFTSLVNYQAFKENAPECLAIIHYPEFQKDKGIVLMHGEYNTDVLNGTDACFLANQLQLYYASAEDSRKYKLLSEFTNDPTKFKHMDLVSELANLSVPKSKN
ncbi:hypothetical protein CHUAL_009404 [Chamberlinius hualienensis]